MKKESKPGEMFKKFQMKKKLSATGGAYVRNYDKFGKPGSAKTLGPAMASGKAHFEANKSGGEYIMKKKGKVKKKSGLRPASAVVKSEQNASKNPKMQSADTVVNREQKASHQRYKKPGELYEKAKTKKRKKLAVKKPVGPKGDSAKTSTASNTKTATATKTATSTEAYTQGNVTVTGGAGAGATHVFIGGQPPAAKGKTGTSKVGSVKSKKK